MNSKILVVLGATLFLCGLTSHAKEYPGGHVRVITDSLMKDLPCSNLSKETFLTHVSREALSIERQIPVVNWGANALGECWSLSHAQRLFFLMGRFGENDSETNQNLETVSDSLRGKKDGAPELFPVSTIGDLVKALSLGFEDSQGEHRDFTHDIQSYEEWRFYQPGNIDLILGNRDRSKKENALTMSRLSADLAQGRLPLVIIRAALTWQHALVVKRANANADGTVDLVVYDSNHPDIENFFTYDPTEQEFRATAIISAMLENRALTRSELPDLSDTTSPVGVFIVDEKNMDAIQSTLFDYYRAQCG